MRRMHFAAAFALALAFAAGWYVGLGGTGVVRAQSPQEYYVGHDWGPLRGSLGNRLLLFEDASGAIRVVDVTDINPSTKMLRIERILSRK